MKSVRNRRFSGPYSVRMRGNTGQKNSKHGHFHAVSGDMQCHVQSHSVESAMLHSLIIAQPTPYIGMAPTVCIDKFIGS